jgi:molybdenum cofactor guanylyltransferase
MENKHLKHAKLSRPNIGNFGRNEFAFVGTPCGVIQQLTSQIIEKLHGKYKITYVDADHKNANDATVETRQCLVSTEFIDKITFQRLDYQTVTDYQKKFLLNEQDLILINGNHFEANQQIVFIDPLKEQSLLKRLPKLTNIKAFILTDGVEEIYDFLKNDDWQNVPTFRLSETEKISQFIDNQVVIPKINGLVLAGGKSTRMGTDKGLLNYHGKPQREFTYNLLENLCSETFISFRKNQENDENLPILEDTFLELGPFGAILSAFQQNPNTAWLVVACDLPLLDKKTLDILIEKRNPAKIATTFYNPATDFPEPLITIWEPKSYQILLQFLALGISCPRKVLINSDVEIIHLSNAEVLMNANTFEDFQKVQNLLGIIHS